MKKIVNTSITQQCTLQKKEFLFKANLFFLKNDTVGFKNMKKVKFLILHYFSIFKALCAVSSNQAGFAAVRICSIFANCNRIFIYIRMYLEKWLKVFFGWYLFISLYTQKSYIHININMVSNLEISPIYCPKLGVIYDQKNNTNFVKKMCIFSRKNKIITTSKAGLIGGRVCIG